MLGLEMIYYYIGAQKYFLGDKVHGVAWLSPIRVLIRNVWSLNEFNPRIEFKFWIN